LQAHFYTGESGGKLFLEPSMAFYWFQRAVLSSSLAVSWSLPDYLQTQMRSSRSIFYTICQSVRGMIGTIYNFAGLQPAENVPWATYVCMFLLCDAPSLSMDDPLGDHDEESTTTTHQVALSAVMSLPPSILPRAFIWSNLNLIIADAWGRYETELMGLLSQSPDSFSVVESRPLQSLSTVPSTSINTWHEYEVFSPWSLPSAPVISDPLLPSCAAHAGDLWVHSLRNISMAAPAHCLSLWYTAAAMNSIEAMRCLGMAYLNGLQYVKPNCVLAAEWLGLAAHLNDVVARTELDKLISPAIAKVYMNALNNDAEAQFLLGLLYDQGPTIPTSASTVPPPTTALWTDPWRNFVLAALRPPRPRRASMTFMFSPSEMASLVEASKTPVAAAPVSGSTPHLRRRNSFLVVPEVASPKSIAVPVDEIKWPAGIVRCVPAALYWFDKASQNGHPGAKNNFAALLDAQFASPQADVGSKVFLLLSQAADQGNPMAMYNLGVLYENGRSDVVETNIDASFKW
jgi:TPR repeat protein